ncbi:MAG: hypothetical protein A3K46_07775 [Chloroflexi bacterium RBG_13_60_9]|nr:MAG: hypothetical protein A3K46_07775 [Chloroflexi bacterium RBG_13_60_9]
MSNNPNGGSVPLKPPDMPERGIYYELRTIEEPYTPPEAALIAAEMERAANEIFIISGNYETIMESLCDDWEGRAYRRFMELYRPLEKELSNLDISIREKAKQIRQIQIMHKRMYWEGVYHPERIIS